MRISENTVVGVERMTDAKKSPVVAPVVVKSEVSSVKIDAASQAVSVRASATAAARSEKVQKIASDLKAGTYQVDLKKLAGAIAADELQRG